MRSLALGAALTLLASNAVQVEARLFPRAVKGNGFLKVPVGAVDRSRQSNKRDEGNSILTVLDNMDFFYATDSKLTVAKP